MHRVPPAVSLVVAVLAAAAEAQQPPAHGAPAKEEHVRGTVAAVQGDTVTVASPDGRTRTTLRLAERTRVSTASKADLGAIQKNGYVGVTAVAGKGGALRALEVHVFPESARGAGEGHRPWDLKPGSTMTNAMVSTVEPSEGKGASSGSSMTNATVSDVSGAAGGTQLELTYPGGKQTVIVPPGVPVVRLEAADRSAIQDGARVFAAGARQPDGSVAVDRMVVGKGGAVPPM
jgi:hypothetical protein